MKPSSIVQTRSKKADSSNVNAQSTTNRSLCPLCPLWLFCSYAVTRFFFSLSLQLRQWHEREKEKGGPGQGRPLWRQQEEVTYCLRVDSIGFSRSEAAASSSARTP